MPGLQADAEAGVRFWHSFRIEQPGNTPDRRGQSGPFSVQENFLESMDLGAVLEPSDRRDAAVAGSCVATPRNGPDGGVRG